MRECSLLAVVTGDEAKGRDSFRRLKKTKPKGTFLHCSDLFLSCCLHLLAIIQIQLSRGVGKHRDFEQSINMRMNICFITVNIAWIGEKKECEVSARHQLCYNLHFINKYSWKSLSFSLLLKTAAETMWLLFLTGINWCSWIRSVVFQYSWKLLQLDREELSLFVRLNCRTGLCSILHITGTDSRHLIWWRKACE